MANTAITIANCLAINILISLISVSLGWVVGVCQAWHFVKREEEIVNV